MDPAELIPRLAYHGKIPVEAVHDARNNWSSVAPALVRTVEQFLSGDRSNLSSLWIIFHLFAEVSERSAYRPLARLLRCPSDDIDAIFASTDSETVHKVMAAVFDGDPKPLYEVILDPEADEYIRGRMLETVAMVTLRGKLARDEASRFLQACFTDIVPQDTCVAWDGWQRAIALLGLADLKPLVEQVYDRGFISLGWSEFSDFEADLQKGVDDPKKLLREAHGDYDAFCDTLEELSFYDADESPEADGDDDDDPLDFAFDGPPPGKHAHSLPPVVYYPPVTTVISPLRKVGRNDPCPCGSGKKYKKCCLTAAADKTAIAGEPNDELETDATQADAQALPLPGKSKR
jgi:Protein of unknown function (DUF1186)/SEC-C motif